MATEWLVDGWQQRTQQKVAFAGFMAALLSLRGDPLKSASRLRDFLTKLAGYGGAAVIFSGVQETCRAVRGRHDFLNSAFSGAVTGALVVGHFQGPQYRLLGVVTWGSLSAALHFANAALSPRYYLEEYLIHEGLLSPEATRYRPQAQSAQQRGPGGSGSGSAAVPALEQRDVLVEVKAIRDRELRLINDRAAAPTAGSGPPAAARVASAEATAGPRHTDDLPDDDPGYQAWLRSSGFQADALLVAPSQQQQQQQLLRSAVNGIGSDGGVGGEERGDSGQGSEEGGDAAGQRAVKAGDTEATAAAKGRSSWGTWLQPWKWRLRKGPSAGDEL